MNPHYAVVAARAGHRCEYCHAPEAIFNFPFEVEHVVPPQRGGDDSDANLALACRPCNLFKSDALEAIDAELGRTARLYHPRQDTWEDHFTVNIESGAIESLTAVARATIAQLRMNTPTQLVARKQWAQLGLYP